eukprot:TRINITY_DN5885_c0_g1_i2.p1 TRINITY_DN5885_c0_g1~~TRINITY_DN5885_c0_g1_i2.p1  ORF type:complete len:806 (-),score=153.64 TRINITY_DN5885_c0_g1_i2:2-2419(-)
MTTGDPFVPRVVFSFLWLTFFHACLDTFKRHAANRVGIENRLLIRRLVFERLLYSEMGAFEKLRTLDVEYRISADISQTLNFFSFTLPQMVASLYALSREGFELYRMRASVDPLALAYPIVIGVTRKLASYVKYHFIEKKQRDVISKTRTKMSRLVSNALDGIGDIQVNNLQPQQLKELDKLIETELSNSLGMKSLVYNTWNLFSHRNVLEFVAELFVVHKVMRRQHISHERYSKIQHDINRVIELVQRVYGLIRITRNMLEFQKEVVELVNIPNFLHEHTQLNAKLAIFRELKVSNMFFSYKEHEQPALDFYGTLTFEPGKRYALIGQNRSGKSTLCKLITKLYQPQLGSITLNGISYHRISRVALRDYISYLSQKPYLFPGTIRDNIRIGNPYATDEQVYAAAEAAGVFAYGIQDDFLSSRPAAPRKDAPPPGPIRRSMSMNDMASQLLNSSRTPLSRLLLPPIPEIPPPSQVQQKSLQTQPQQPYTEFTETPLVATTVPSSPASRAGRHLTSSTSSLSSPSFMDSDSSIDTVARLRRIVSSTETNAKLLQNAEGHADSSLRQESRHSSSTKISRKEAAAAKALKKEQEEEDEEEEKKPLLNRVLSFVWEAETDIDSYYSRKKEKKAKRKAKAKKKRQQQREQQAKAQAEGGESAESGGSGETPRRAMSTPRTRSGASILDMKLTSRGGNISGGFAQSVALARVFVRTDAKIIILDEALGQMDALKKRDIIFPSLMRFVKKWKMTLIMVTHDIPSVVGMDVIYVFQKGKLMHQGSHEQLMDEKAPHYLELVSADQPTQWDAMF